jgi:Leucine rich repeat/Leucine Rich repeats (2 copies)
MSSTKSRGRPSATQIIEATSTSPLISNIATAINSPSALQQQYVPSLLKIESVVPTRLNASRNLHNRANRLITRSYSTLCGPTTLTTNGNGAAVNYKNVTKKINTNLHRHKNHHHHHHHHHQNYHHQQQHQQYSRYENERHESPTGKINNSNQQAANEATSMAIENGVSKVRRTVKEKERQPDRINLDRRGLCTIPVIDNEPNLRLLSLQHNLINTFHIPDCEVTIELPANNTDGVKDNNNNVPSKDMDKCNGGQLTMSNKSTAMMMTTTTKPLQRQKSRNQLNLNFSANSNATATTNGSGTGILKANGSSVVSVTTTATSTSFLQKSFMFQSSKSGLLKRANSVMINYSPSQTPSPSATLQSSIFSQRGKLVATPSFSMMDTSTHHEMASGIGTGTAKPASTPESLQIDANNSYMSSFRFNLSNLVFLDLYNNQIEKISNLDGLKSLTVLLLGKNRISDISGITSVKQTLRVLDLHGNRITHITQKICQLQELKSLNLAGNLLRQIQPNDFAGLCCLKELNLKRNRIKKINVSDDLHNLER